MDSINNVIGRAVVYVDPVFQTGIAVTLHDHNNMYFRAVTHPVL